MGLREAREAEDLAKSQLVGVRERLAAAALVARDVQTIERELAQAREQEPGSAAPYREHQRDRIDALEKRMDAARRSRVERAALRIEEGRLLRDLEASRVGLERAGVRRVLPLLDVVIASPCPAKWEEMEGDGDMRFCASCAKHVFNLTMMSHEEAEATVRSATDQGGACLRLYRRIDGTVLTQDCPVALRQRRFWRRSAGVAAAGLLLAALGALGYSNLVQQAHCSGTDSTSGGSMTTGFQSQVPH